MNYQEIVDWLFQQVPNYQHQGGTAYKPGLDRIKDLLERFGNPHKRLKTIHVAGTNGKGSVSHILSAIFQKHGYKTGLYTSPHITDFRERIKINGELIDESVVVDFFEGHKEDFEAINPSFFELTTALAFEAFVQNNCDIAIIETGLGGRLDSTNDITPELSIITNIGIDHTKFLGNSLEEIAIEKAGIIKPKVPVVIGDMNPSLRSVFNEVADQNTSDIVFTEDQDYEMYETDLLGSFQQRNIHTAVTAVMLLKNTWNLDQLIVNEALCNIASLTNFKGRLQRVSINPRVIFDAAHNEEGIKNLLKEIDHFYYNDLRIVYGSSNDKDWAGIIRNFPMEAIYYFTEFDSKRSVTKEEFDEELKNKKLIYNAYHSVEEALSRCKSDAKSNDLILVCGSFYMMEKII